MLIYADEMLAVKPIWIIDEQMLAFIQDSGVGSISGCCPGPGRCAPPSNDEFPCPSVFSAPLTVRTLRAAGSLGSYLGVTRGRIPGTGSGARSRADCGVPSVWLVCGKLDRRVAQGALVPCVDITGPPIDAASQCCMVSKMCWPITYGPRLSRCVSALESVQSKQNWACLGLQMDGVGISIIERPQPVHSHDMPNPAHHICTFKCEESINYRLRAGGLQFISVQMVKG